MPRLPILLAIVTLAGCEFDPPMPAVGPQPQARPAVSTFDPAQSGAVTGRVTWAGPAPAAEDFLFGVPAGDGHFQTRMMRNPNRPAVAGDGTVAGAVVFLRGVDPAAAKPWHLPPVRVELADRQIVVRQGDRAGRVGFVRRGDQVEMASAEPVFHVLRGRGAAFFSLTFPDERGQLTRTFDRLGRVELSSGAGLYWANADLFVTDHPYYAVTGTDGRFAFEQVPAGPVEVVAWHPGWTPAGRDRDPESGLVTRMTYGPPVEAAGRATVTAGGSAAVGLTLDAAAGGR